MGKLFLAPLLAGILFFIGCGAAKPDYSKYRYEVGVGHIMHFYTDEMPVLSDGGHTICMNNTVLVGNASFSRPTDWPIENKTVASYCINDANGQYQIRVITR